MSETVTAYFSLRSPYSWLALHRLERLGERLGAPLTLVPVFPRDASSAPNPVTQHARFRYLLEDVGRMASAYGLTIRPPASLDVAWELPHAAFSFAAEAGLGLPFALAAFEARFTRSRDLGSLDELAEIATLVGLDPLRVVEAAKDPARHARIDAGMSAANQAGVIGVPFFVYAGKRFWGNDRLEWLLREIDRTNGHPIASLEGDACFRPAWSPGEG